MDEAFVDLTGAYLHGQDPVALAQRARDRIAQELSLPSLCGVAPNKLLAKMASTGSKPNGLWVIPPERVQEFLDPEKSLRPVGSGCEKYRAALPIRYSHHRPDEVHEPGLAQRTLRCRPGRAPLGHGARY